MPSTGARRLRSAEHIISSRDRSPEIHLYRPIHRQMAGPTGVECIPSLPLPQTISAYSYRFAMCRPAIMAGMAKYAIFLELGGRRTVLVGGGAVAVRKAEALLEAGARLVVVAYKP